ncbi:dihydrofolate reductase family protein [Nonomuraea jabiensis]|uniref:Riboflavin biosynthesis pyrimidine reductase n=1 Tax=Nonomuraea jabiensis TaxID=882448 RepID=A0A7W9LCZ2_9ACTN|nr:dihydrofolate reductase family protein [Nonomuraea jabiensis]MBB5779068.1 riboflavin biosynthesis pyrimidine reductase [Nonomuraea jabiensis]
MVTGSVTLVQELLRAGLLDELRLLIDPVVGRDPGRPRRVRSTTTSTTA